MSTEHQPTAAELQAAEDVVAKAEGESVRIPSDPIHKWVVLTSGVALTGICLAWVGQIPYYFGTAYYREQFLALVLGFAIALVYNALSWHGRPHRSFSPIDLVRD
jgi:hypothetical protein